MHPPKYKINDSVIIPAIWGFYLEEVIHARWTGKTWKYTTCHKYPNWLTIYHHRKENQLISPKLNYKKINHK